MSEARHSGPEKPRLRVDFDDNRNGSVLIKRVVRNASGRAVEDILPKHAVLSSGSESTTSELAMAKRRESHRRRDNSRERRERRKRHRHTKHSGGKPHRGDARLSKRLESPSEEHKQHKRGSDKRASRRRSNSHRKSDDSEEEAPPGRCREACVSIERSVQKTEAPPNRVSCSTSITPWRFEEPPSSQAMNFPAGPINLTLNVCGVPGAPTVVEKTSGITIQCNHPQPLCARTQVDAQGTTAALDVCSTADQEAQPPLRASQQRAGGQPPSEGNVELSVGTAQSSSMVSVVAYSSDSGGSSLHQAMRDSGPRWRRSPSGTISSECYSVPWTPWCDPKRYIDVDEVLARVEAVKRELSQKHNSSLPPREVESSSPLTIEQSPACAPRREPHPDVRGDPSARIPTPRGPSRKPYMIANALPPPVGRYSWRSSPESVPEEVKNVMLEAYMNDCVASLESRSAQRAPPRGQRCSNQASFPTGATFGDDTSCGGTLSVSSRKSEGTSRSLGSHKPRIDDDPELDNLINEMFSLRQPDAGNSANPENPQSIENSASYAQESLTRLMERWDDGRHWSPAFPATLGPEPYDDFGGAFRTPPMERPVAPDRFPPSGSESLHLPVVITDRKNTTRQQFVEVQVKDKNLNRERVSSCFDSVDRGPPIPEILVTLSQNTLVNRFEEITLEDVRRASLIGQFDRSFLALSKDSAGTTLLLIDQHALHERILLEQLEDECFRNTDSPTPTVILAPAITVTLREPAQIQLVKRDLQMMENHGFLVKILENEAISIQTGPRCLSSRDVDRLRRTTANLFEEFLRGSGTFSSVFHRLLKSKACHAAIKCPMELDKATQERLIQDMLKCRLPFQCCHGRPSINPVPSNTLRVSTQDQASQSALWNKIKVNIDMKNPANRFSSEEGAP